MSKEQSVQKYIEDQIGSMEHINQIRLTLSNFPKLSKNFLFDKKKILFWEMKWKKFNYQLQTQITWLWKTFFLNNILQDSVYHENFTIKDSLKHLFLSNLLKPEKFPEYGWQYGAVNWCCWCCRCCQCDCCKYCCWWKGRMTLVWSKDSSPGNIIS